MFKEMILSVNCLRHSTGLSKDKPSTRRSTDSKLSSSCILKKLGGAGDADLLVGNLKPLEKDSIKHGMTSASI